VNAPESKRMSRNLIPRVAALIAAALISISYFLPLWGFSIYAPQYPEGLYMTIYGDRFGGDVRNINILNHYVGMKAIEAADFPEFTVFPLVLGLFAAFCILLAIYPSLRLFRVWLILFISGGVLGVWRMARWGIEYGTNLSPHAPIKVPGMHFIPPLLGKKLMLNITSYSYPHWGALSLALAFLFMSAAVAWSFLKKVPKPLAVVFATFLLSGCFSPEKPEPIAFGSDTCAHCRMTISDNRFGGEVILKGGKIHKFDSLGCVHSYSEENKDKVSKVFLIDFFEPGAFVPSEEARFVMSSSIRGPMGQDILVSHVRNEAKLLKEGSVIRTWQYLSSQKKK
jgi:copper chaperone NosL